MPKILTSLAASTLVTLTIPVIATEIATTTLDNGAEVRLNDDFTWEYVILTTNKLAPAPLIAASAITSQSVDTQAEAHQTKSQMTVSATTTLSTPTLTANAMSQAGLLKSTAKGGVKVRFIKSQWDKEGRLGLSFNLVSSSAEHYVLIELDVTLFDDSGKQLKTETLKVWQAIFRMPETYLRKGQQGDSKIFWIEGLNPKQWTKELMSLKIGEMNSRM